MARAGAGDGALSGNGGDWGHAGRRQFCRNCAGLVGLDQLNVQIPRSLIGRGAANVAVTINGTAANVVSINLK
jgi:uncharacterized protein (TIGR03437 family)